MTTPPAVAEFDYKGGIYLATSQLSMGVCVVVFESEGEQVARYVYPSRTPQDALVKALEAWYEEAGHETTP